MPPWLPSIPYPTGTQPGRWRPITSTLNWCEEDYYATPFVAEIVNTLTNLLFLALSIRGIRNCLRCQHDRIFLVAFIGYGMVGSGSLLFHASLKYSMQLVDELSMIYTACFMFYGTFTHFREGRFHFWLAIALVSLATFITLYYHYLQDPRFHQNAFTILTALILSRSMWIMEKHLRPMGRNEREDDQTRIRDILSNMWIMVAYALTVFLSGFAIWGLDIRYCSDLIRWRRQLGLPWGILLEGHAWWHILTGVGSYFYIVWVIWLRYCLKGKHRQFRLVWPSMFFSLPDVVANSEGQVEPATSKKKR